MGLEKERDFYREKHIETCKTVDQRDAEIEKLRDMLLKHEWSADWRVDYDDTASSCPECAGINPDDYHVEDGNTDGQPIGHAEGCAYAALIGKSTDGQREGGEGADQG